MRNLYAGYGDGLALLAQSRDASFERTNSRGVGRQPVPLYGLSKDCRCRVFGCMRAYLPDYDLVVAKDLDDAVHLLASGESRRPIAGGTDMMVLLNAGKLFC